MLDSGRLYWIVRLQGLPNQLNFCLLGYGQTSSGKSYTMIGERESPGLVPRFLGDLFSKAAELREESRFEVHYSFFEIYKEKIFDLLQPSEKSLNIREFLGNEVVIEGLLRRRGETLAEVYTDLGQAIARRRANETTLNARSSRSHFVSSFEISLTCELQTGKGACQVTKNSKIIFVDLAGSEKQANNERETMAEGCAINRSLSVLAHVVNALSRKTPAFLHFRDSKLTHFLKECFTGNAHIAIVGNVLLQKEYLAETHSTLAFISAAQRVRTDPHFNVETHSSYSEKADIAARGCALIREELSRISSAKQQELLDKLTRLYDDHITAFPNPQGSQEFFDSTIALHTSSLPLVLQLRRAIETQKEESLNRLSTALEKLSTNILKLEFKQEEPRSFLSEGATIPSMIQALPDRAKASPLSDSSILSGQLAAQRAALDADFQRLEVLKAEIAAQREAQLEELRALASQKPCEKPPTNQMKKIADLERQLRNRNKDYLFALKEIEKLKISQSQFAVGIDSSFRN